MQGFVCLRNILTWWKGPPIIIENHKQFPIILHYGSVCCQSLDNSITTQPTMNNIIEFLPAPETLHRDHWAMTSLPVMIDPDPWSYGNFWHHGHPWGHRACGSKSITRITELRYEGTTTAYIHTYIHSYSSYAVDLYNNMLLILSMWIASKAKGHQSCSVGVDWLIGWIMSPHSHKLKTRRWASAPFTHLASITVHKHYSSGSTLSLCHKWQTSTLSLLAM